MPAAMSQNASLSPDLIVRDLEAADYHRGFLECLTFLTKVGEIPQSKFNERLELLKGLPNLFRVRVIEDRAHGKIVGAGTLLVEPKFIRECGSTGHIEDIVVHEAARGLGLGKMIIKDLTDLAKAAGCYKVTLECSDDNVPFYAKCGLERKGNQMCLYF